MNGQMIIAALAGVEDSVGATGTQHEKGGVDAAVEFLACS